MRIIVLLLTIILIFDACSEYQSKVETVVPKLDPVAEQYAVYSVLINQYASDKVLMVNNQTTIDKISKRSPEQTFQSYDLTIPPEFQVALEDYINANQYLKTSRKKATASFPQQCSSKPSVERTLLAF